MYPSLPNLASRLLANLTKGKCLVLLDGLDEVANDDLRRRVVRAIYKFISDYSEISNPKFKYYNSFVITSRIVGYESVLLQNTLTTLYLTLKTHKLNNF